MATVNSSSNVNVSASDLSANLTMASSEEFYMLPPACTVLNSLQFPEVSL